MKFEVTPARAAALVALIASVEAAQHGHAHRHGHAHEARTVPENVTLEKKSGQCQFPSDAGLVAITPGEQNAGWAMSPNQPCKPGNYCPYACPPGQVSMQWDPEATSYSYPMSMNGGLYCDESGNIQKPFPNKPYCADGTGAVQAMNKAGKPVAFCQTVLPGNEAMLIPTLVEELSTLAVPGMSYWCATAAQYYVNAPGVSVEEACVWGTSANPVGNWSPYTAGANTVANGDTYLKIGWNPIYLEPATPFRNVKPEFGIEILCEGGGCNGLPCRIDPSTMGVNEMSAPDVFTGAGGATGCVVTVPSGAKANIVVFDLNGDSSSETVSVSTSSASKTSTAAPTSSTEAPSTTSTPADSTSSAAATSDSASAEASSSGADFSNTRGSKLSSTISYTYRPHVFTGSAEISMASATGTASTATAAAAATAATTSASHNGAATTAFSTVSAILGAIAALALNL